MSTDRVTAEYDADDLKFIHALKAADIRHDRETQDIRHERETQAAHEHNKRYCVTGVVMTVIIGIMVVLGLKR